MKLVPFVCQHIETSVVTTYSFIVFLTEGGRDLWEIGAERNLDVIRREYLEDNGFVCTSQIWINEDVVYAELDPERTNFASFYNWLDIQAMPEKKRDDCFRLYILPMDRETGALWFPSPILDTPFQQSPLTPYALFQGLKNSEEEVV